MDGLSLWRAPDDNYSFTGRVGLWHLFIVRHRYVMNRIGVVFTDRGLNWLVVFACAGQKPFLGSGLFVMVRILERKKYYNCTMSFSANVSRFTVALHKCIFCTGIGSNMTRSQDDHGFTSTRIIELVRRPLTLADVQSRNCKANKFV